MRDRSEALTNLLLASAPLRAAPGTDTRAPYFLHAWDMALKGEAEPAFKSSIEAVRRLLRVSLALCEASGMTGTELTIFYNDRRDASEFATPAELDELLAAAADELLTMIAARHLRSAEEAA